MEGRDRGQVLAVARRFERRLAAHAIADRAETQVCRRGVRAQGRDRRRYPRPIAVDVAPQGRGQRAGMREIAHRLAVEVGDQCQVTRFRQHPCPALYRRVGVGDRREQHDSGARAAGWPGEQPGQRGVAVAVGDRLERAHSGRKSGTER